jgi:restriction system protein
MGFKTEVTKRSGDHGIDVYATRHTSDGGKETLAIQCKHYPGRTVGEPEATSLWGAIYADHKISRGVLVTTGKFSKQCKDFVEGKRIRLIERGELEMLLRTYKLS